MEVIHQAMIHQLDLTRGPLRTREIARMVGERGLSKAQGLS